MKKLLLLICILLSLYGYAQTETPAGNPASSKNKNALKTGTIPHITFQLDLCRPGGAGFKIPGMNRSKMIVKNNETVSLEVININPFKYEIKIDNKSVSNHMEGNAFIDSLKKFTTPRFEVNPLLAYGTDSTTEKMQEWSAKKLKEMFQMIYQLKALELSLSTVECINIKEEQEKLAGLYLQFQEGLMTLNTITKISLDQFSKYQLQPFMTVDGDTTHAGHLRIIKTEAKFREFAKLQQARYITLPVAPNGNTDYIQFEVSKTLKATNTTEKNITEKQSYEVWVRGGVKIDFSASAWGTGLTDEKYALKEVRVDGTTRQQILKQDEGKFAFAFGSQVNCLWRAGTSFIRPGVSFGVAFTDDSNFQLMPGITLLMGKESRLGITGGFAFGKVQRLDSAYEVRGYYDGGSSTLPTVNKFTYAPFAGITYNLSKTKEQKKEETKE